MRKNIAIIGLGLIGGSMAKTIKTKTEHKIYGFDTNPETLQKAFNDKSIDCIFDDSCFAVCDTFIIALYPGAIKEFVIQNIAKFKKATVIIDCAGVKESICKELSPLAAVNGLYFIGGHPMAGTEKSGYDNATATLFNSAAMILCTDETTNIVALKAAELLFLSIGFGSVTVTTAKKHDETIAFTSQLAHIVSNAYIKSETAKNQSGFSAGSYKDLTRVAKLNPDMWTELFFENRESLLAEAKSLVERLAQYIHTLETNDPEGMKQLLAEGSKIKEMIG